MSTDPRIKKLVKTLAFALGQGPRVFRLYPFMHEPAQLQFITSTLEDAAHLPGCCLEIGCAYGATTVYLNKYLYNIGLTKKYYAIDTFSGFTDRDVAYEVENRGKSPILSEFFSDNKFEWVEQSLQHEGVANVELIRADAADFDFSLIPEISFCLVDIDLYKPIAAILPRLFQALTPGGVIIVDDCLPNTRWDGALQAYQEFTRENGMPERIHFEKLGVIRREISECR